ncbi:MAG: hypothetical protein EA424_00300, partial [Planctomycetaceae bacterium]
IDADLPPRFACVSPFLKCQAQESEPPSLCGLRSQFLAPIAIFVKHTEFAKTSEKKTTSGVSGVPSLSLGSDLGFACPIIHQPKPPEQIVERFLTARHFWQGTQGTHNYLSGSCSCAADPLETEQHFVLDAAVVKENWPLDIAALAEVLGNRHPFSDRTCNMEGAFPSFRRISSLLLPSMPN